VVSYFLRYFSSISTEQIFPDSAGLFTSFGPVYHFDKIASSHCLAQMAGHWMTRNIAAA
jgi:hypothetical protein